MEETCLFQDTRRILAIFLLLFSSMEAATNELVIPDNAQCACPGDLLTFTCTVGGGGNTIWSGNAFNCSESRNEILLRHMNFAGSTGTSGHCNNGAITSRSLEVENDICFISELNVTVTPKLNNKTIQCGYTDTMSGMPSNIGSVSLNVISATNHYPPPTRINVTDTAKGRITFNWTSSCSSGEYIITSDCGICPPSTNTTSATCTNLQVPTASGTVACTFGVSSRVCGINGTDTTPVSLSVPDIPRVNIVPYYTNESQQLQRLFLEVAMNKTAVISNDISGPVLSYSVVYSINTLMNQTMIPVKLCEDNVCNYQVAISPCICSTSTDLNVTVSASNKIGKGKPSRSVTLGCTNTFVRLNFNSNTSTFFCTFLNEQLNGSRKLCIIHYGMCDQELNRTAQDNSTAENSNTVSVMLPDLVAGTYCYVVTASYSTRTIKVEGTLRQGPGTLESNNASAIALGIALPVASVVILLFIILIVVLRFRNRTAGKNNDGGDQERFQELSEINQRMKVPDGYFIVKEVDKDSITLKDFCKRHKICCDYGKFNVFLETAELTKVEHKDDALLMDENRTLYTVPYFQESVTEVDHLRVFKVCRSKQSLILKKDMLIVYENPNFIRGHFRVLKVDEDVEMSEFLKRKLDSHHSFKSERAFFEFVKAEDIPRCTKMIRVPATWLKPMSKPINGEASIKTFYNIYGGPGREIKPKNTNHFKDFIHSQSQEPRYLKKETFLLYLEGLNDGLENTVTVAEDKTSEPDLMNEVKV